MSSGKRPSSGSIRGSFFNQNPTSNNQQISSHTSSQRTTSNRSNGRTSNGRTNSRKNMKGTSEKNDIDILTFTPENEAEINELKSIVRTADELRRNNEIMNVENIFEKENMENVKKQKQSIKERTKDLVRKGQLDALIKNAEKLYTKQRDAVDKIKPGFFNNSKLKKQEKLMYSYGNQLKYLYDQSDIINKKIRDEKTVPNELLKDVGLLNKRLKVLNEDESNPNSKYYDDKFFAKKYRKSTRNRGGSRRTRRKR
jgi:hypothetical protein